MQKSQLIVNFLNSLIFKVESREIVVGQKFIEVPETIDFWSCDAEGRIYYRSYNHIPDKTITDELKNTFANLLYSPRDEKEVASELERKMLGEEEKYRGNQFSFSRLFSRDKKILAPLSGSYINTLFNVANTYEKNKTKEWIYNRMKR